MLKNRSFIFIILLAMIACSNVTNQNGNGNAPGDEKVVAQEGYKEIQIGDSITVSVPDATWWYNGNILQGKKRHSIFICRV